MGLMGLLARVDTLLGAVLPGELERLQEEAARVSAELVAVRARLETIVALKRRLNA